MFPLRECPQPFGRCLILKDVADAIQANSSVCGLLNDNCDCGWSSLSAHGPQLSHFLHSHTFRLLELPAATFLKISLENELPNEGENGKPVEDSEDDGQGAEVKEREGIRGATARKIARGRLIAADDARILAEEQGKDAIQLFHLSTSFSKTTQLPSRQTC